MRTRDEAAASAAETASSVVKPAEGEPKAEAKAKGDGKRTPEEWAKHAYPYGGRDGKKPHASLWQHSAAAALHGWAEHAHHEGAPIRLTGEDYFAALVAASDPDKQGTYQPHAAALSKHAPGKG